MSAGRQLKPIWVSVKDTTRLIPFGTTKIYEMINDGRLKSCRMGGRRMIRFDSIERLGADTVAT